MMHYVIGQGFGFLLQFLAVGAKGSGLLTVLLYCMAELNISAWGGIAVALLDKT